jgi:hypothetical protein
MGLEPGKSLEGVPIDFAFIGSCTDAISPLAAAASNAARVLGSISSGDEPLVEPLE